MTDPRTIPIREFTYSLPEERIAKYPLEERDASKLLLYKNGNISEDIYRHLAAHIPSGATLVFNDTKVVEARLLFQKPSGGVIEIFCLEPHEKYADISSAMLQKNKVWWQCMIGGASKWKHGQVLEKKIGTAGSELTLRAAFIEKRPDIFVIELSWSDPQLCFAEILHLAGLIPLPPYLKRTAEMSDTVRYQTVYAKEEGSVAAPTAGLHFTDRVLHELYQKNIRTEYLTLHVGAGTFKPVKTATMNEHIMHSEWIDVPRDRIEHILANTDAVVAVGTTSLRTLESLYWMGIMSRESNRDPLTVSQWYPYEHPSVLSAPDALRALLTWMDNRNMKRLVARTSILIAPGYEFRIVKGLITNFHQPESTLLLLVAALIGDDWRKLYRYALDNEFRFLSYGDGSLLWRI